MVSQVCVSGYQRYQGPRPIGRLGPHNAECAGAQHGSRSISYLSGLFFCLAWRLSKYLQNPDYMLDRTEPYG